jgi:hypothetical protein
MGQDTPRDAFAEAHALAYAHGLLGRAVLLAAEGIGFEFWTDGPILRCERPPGVTGALWRAWRLLIVLNARAIGARLEERETAAS